MKKNGIFLRLLFFVTFCFTQIFATLNFTNRDVNFLISGEDSIFKISNQSSIHGYKKQQIIRNNCPEGIFLIDNQLWGTVGNIFVAGEEPFTFASNFVIPDSTVITFSVNVLVDGKYFDLILGKRAQLLIDSGVTVTFKNLIFKNSLNTSSIPPIKCLDQTSKVCFDNVRFELNDDFIFSSGQMFFNNDVEFTGTSKFSYRSTSRSYILAKSSLKFAPQTTFEYYPASNDNALIKMVDKTSAIVFDECTLQTTLTGMRLTKGSLYFDNNVTLSSTSVIRPSQGFSNAIIFGNFSAGIEQDLDVYLFAAARVGVYGKIWQDSVNSGLNFQGRDSYISLDRYDSKFKITNAENVKGFKNSQIIKGSVDNTLFLQDNQVWQINGDIAAPGGENFEFMNDLNIPDGQIVGFYEDTALDGNGFNLILGKYAQLFVDSNVTITLKNMKICNMRNNINIPLIDCADSRSKVFLDNVIFALNDDWIFEKGQLFIYNDVEFTGTSKFSYRSAQPSYIMAHSNLIFDTNTVFEFYPDSTDNSLINMVDKTSGIIFNGSTLQATHTGIRLTKGCVYFDNKVTLSSANNTLLTLSDPIQTVLSRYTTSAAWSPNGNYVFWGNSAAVSEIYNFNGSSLSLTTSTYYTRETKAVAWSPDGNYVVLGNSESIVVAVSEIYNFNGSSLSLTASTRYRRATRSVSWSPDGNYVVLGNYNQISDIYRFDGNSLYLVTSTPSAKNTESISWSSDGNYVALGNYNQVSDIYRFDGNSLYFVTSTPSAKDTKSISWSSDGNYVALGNYNQVSDIYKFDENILYFIISTSDSSRLTRSIAWSADGKYLAIGNLTQTSDIYRFNNNSLYLFSSTPISEGTIGVAWGFKYGYLLAIANIGPSTSTVYTMNYHFDTSYQGYSRSIVFGNSALGVGYDVDLYILGGANLNIGGKVWYDDVN